MPAEPHSLLPNPGATPYALLMFGAIVASLIVWIRLTRRDRRLPLIYIGGLGGAFLGAKLVYLLAEGWLHLGDPDVLLHLATGKSILGAFLGGYAGVELAKWTVRYRQPTGDWFAVIAPLGIILGRIGCWTHGCCPGVPWDEAWFTLKDAAGQPRWPAVPLELGFNVIALGVVLLCRSRGLFPGQLFHLYLMAYGTFRFAHEFVRDTPHILGSLSGYQAASLVVAATGAIGYALRARQDSWGTPFNSARINGARA